MPTKTRTLSDKFWLVLKGLAMGAANKVPGVSGGVVAYVVGFYEEFINSLKKINGKAFLLLINGRFRSFSNYINGKFLALLTLGMVISYFSVSQLLDLTLERYPLYVWSLFFGMIIGSVYYIGKDFNDWSRQNIVIMLLSVLAGIGISLLTPAQENDNLLFVFFCGVIGVAGMTLPGLSGSFILILLGNYVLLLVDSVNALFDTMRDIFSFNFDFINNPERVNLLKVMGAFTLGSIVGLITLSNFLSFLLKRYKSMTNAGIIGFITGSLGVVWPWKKPVYELDTSGNIINDSMGDPILKNFSRYFPNEMITENFIAILFIILGIGIVVALGKYGERSTAKA